MSFIIPAKTFLIGEYAALYQQPAILIASHPCFKMDILPQEQLINIHPDSPAGLLWQNRTHAYGLQFHDPYHGLGGMGASSAQFIGAYRAQCQLNDEPLNIDDLLSGYYHYAWSGKGLKPSGYDVIAQTRDRCVVVDAANQIIESVEWRFSNLSFMLLHTGKKISTHVYLNELQSLDVNQLSPISMDAIQAFQTNDSERLILSINRYQSILESLQLSALHTIKLVKQLMQLPGVLAVKGCGAMGADIILVLMQTDKIQQFNQYSTFAGLKILATSTMLYNNC